jgi:hypothetical protein
MSSNPSLITSIGSFGWFEPNWEIKKELGR